jgi:hypothetical protein
LGALSVIALCFVMMFVPSLIRGQYPLVADSYCYSYPLRTIAFNMLRHGVFPLWTHELLSGYPLLSMAQVGIGYPLTWGYLFLPGHWAETIYVLAPYLLAPAFTYAYCRELGRSRLAALLAGLSFGYGGLMFSKYTNNGMIPNAVLWLPLILIAVERAVRGSFVPCLLGAAGAYTLSVLSGIGQGFVFTGALALVYALFLCLRSSHVTDDDRYSHLSWRAWQRWRPLAVMLGATLLAAGVAAFQILETMRAARRSVRSTLNYATFGQGSLTLRTVWRSLLLTFYAYEAIDVAAYVAPLTLCLAFCGVVYHVRRRSRDLRVFFWLAAAVVAVVLMLGTNTPVYRLVYHVPVLNQFRVPARHAFEWSFALSMLAAYGWDALGAVVGKRKGSANARRALVSGVIVVTLSAVIGLAWWRAVGRPDSPYPTQYTGLGTFSYLLWKASHTSLLFGGVLLGWRVVSSKWRAGLLVTIMMLACLTEPFILLTSWWLPLHKTASQLLMPAVATRYVQQFSPEQNRVYTRVNLFQEQPVTLERVNPHNLTMLYGLHNIAGYEPFILERYSRALGNVGVDSVNPRPGFPRDDNIFLSDSHVLDLLNTTFVVGYANLSTSIIGGGSREGIEFPAADLAVELKPGESVNLVGLELEADTLAIVTSLAHSTAVEDGRAVGRVGVTDEDGQTLELNLRAGQDTAEWAHERPDVRSHIRHHLALVFDSIPGDEANTFSANRYWTRLSLGKRRRINRVEVANVSESASLALWKAVAFDTTLKTTQPLVTEREFPVALKDTKRWVREFNRDNVLILRNTRSQSRAWLVFEAEAVDGEEALQRIRGEAVADFDPLRTALLEVPVSELPRLGGNDGTSAVRAITYKPNSIEIETEAADTALLVVSETNYPGWVATIDGNRTRTYTTDFILQSVLVPNGRHRVVLRYTAPAARNGAIISLLTLSLLCALAFHARRKKQG